MSRLLGYFAMVVVTVSCLGCASVPREAGFYEVQDAVRQRSGHQAHWEHLEGATSERLETLLQQRLTDKDAVEIALFNNGRLQATFHELGIAQADLVQAGLIRNPIFDGEVRSPGRAFEFAITQSILDLFQRPGRKRLAAATFESEKLRVANEVWNLIVDVRAAFYALQAANQMMITSQTTLEAARASAELAVRLYDAGNIPPLELEREQALLERAKLDLAESESEVLDEREHLNRLMGLWGSQTGWKLVSKLPELPTADLELAGLESLAVSQRLDLLLARQQVEMAAKARPLARLDAIGDIELGIHREREPEGDNTSGPFLAVPLPVFDRGGPARARALAVFLQRQKLYAALAVEVRSEVRSARNRMLTARRKAEYFEAVILPRRRRIVELSLVQYNFMLLGTFELLVARQDEIEARHEFIGSMRDYWIARSELERAVGGNLPTSDSDSAHIQTIEPSTTMGPPDAADSHDHRGDS